MVYLILAESSLELVPEKLKSHPSVISHAKKLGKNTSAILLDNSWHFAAMKGMGDEIKRGRPDLVHFSILEATSIPLYFENRIRIFVHTINDKVIYLGQNVHITKSYHRFAGLMEKLFSEGSITTGDHKLLSIQDKSFRQLIDEITPSQIIGMSTMGKSSSFDRIASSLVDNSCIVVGGFQKGHFSNAVQNQLTDLFSAGFIPLESHVVVARILYEYEKTIFM